ncbi:response regulator [Egbenema bharatensis]|uniref:response regulator n=1 Tax=Egbenema bharatensis TaxID=3463334 RepID=UPI003A852BF1
MASIRIPKRVLVIDDETHVREIIQTCLEAFAGWRVSSAESAKVGLVMVNADPPDAIVLDVTMPEMSGLDFLQALRTNPETQSIPVVLLTARADLIEPDRLRRLAVSGGITKPFDATTLHQQIAQMLGWELL